MKRLRQPENRSAHQLALIVTASGLIYLLVFTLPFLLPNLYQTIPPVDYTKLTGYSPGGFVAYVAAIAALFALYFWAITLLSPKPNTGSQPPVANARFILAAGAGFSAILVFSYPLTAIDLFIYAIRTRGWALYGLQPLATSPEMLPAADPWLGLAGEWVDAASPYGPVWEGLSLALFQLSNTGFLTHLFFLKIVAALACLGTGWLIFKILKLWQPAWAAAGTVAFIWNPLVLFESVQNGHNDILMAFFFVAAIWVYSRKAGTVQWQNHLLVCLLLALSILVKFVTLMVTPFFIVTLASAYSGWPRRFGAIALYGLTVAILLFAGMQPLWPGLDAWAVLEAGSGAGRSLSALLVLGLKNFLSTNTAFDISQNLIFAAFALIYLYHLWQVAKVHVQSPPLPRSPALPVRASFHALFWYVLLAAPVFHAWYLLWFLPLAPLLLPQKRQLNASIVFSITALLVIPYFETVRVWYPLLLQNHFLGHLIGVPLLILPPVITLLHNGRSLPTVIPPSTGSGGAQNVS